MTLLRDVERFVAFKQKLGLNFATESGRLHAFAVWAMSQGDRHVLVSSAVAWASLASSPREKCVRLRSVRKLTVWLHAEDDRHEIPNPDALGRVNIARRPTPHLLKPDEIRLIMDAALCLSPADSINRHTYHYSIGLVASTGLRASEACSLKLSDLVPDGLNIRRTKFGKSRLVVLHPTTRQAIERYLVIRARCAAASEHLFVLSTGNALYPDLLTRTFIKLARKVGLRGGPNEPGTRLHDLRHAFAVRSLEAAIASDRDRVSRHMLALSTYMGHVDVSSTYWYLEATPVLLRQIADVAQSAPRDGRAE